MRTGSVGRRASADTLVCCCGVCPEWSFRSTQLPIAGPERVAETWCDLFCPGNSEVPSTRLLEGISQGFSLDPDLVLTWSQLGPHLVPTWQWAGRDWYFSFAEILCGSAILPLTNIVIHLPQTAGEVNHCDPSHDRSWEHLSNAPSVISSSLKNSPIRRLR